MDSPNFELIRYANLVADMRRAQKRWQRGSDYADFAESRRLEREVDKATKDALTVTFNQDVSNGN
jgi:hypothetical protein